MVRTQTLGMIACGMLGGIIIFGAGIGVGMYPTEVNGRLVSDPAPQLPQATTTIQLPGATITKSLPQATKTIKVPTATKLPNCPSEDSCYADYRGGKWHIIEGDRPMKKSMPKATKKVAERKHINKVPKATTPKKVPGATIAGVCRHPSITTAMVADCNKLASRPAESNANFSNPKGEDLVRECTEQYKGEELAICLR